MPKISLYVPDEDLAQIEAAAEARCVKRGTFIRSAALEAAVEELLATPETIAAWATMGERGVYAYWRYRYPHFEPEYARMVAAKTVELLDQYGKEFDEAGDPPTKPPVTPKISYV